MRAKRSLMLALTLMLSGRAMTLAYLHRVGGPDGGDPPQAWLMPLVGDAVIGLSALCVAYLIWKRQGLWVWLSVIVWNAIAIWDALAAFIVSLSNPWPEFVMLAIFGPSMFFAASAMHVVLIVLICQPDAREEFSRGRVR